MCQDTCPTGIDIRDGLQLECVACTQCIDACDNIMTRLGKPKGLIRFSSQARIDGEQGRVVRPRVIIYPSLILVLLTALGFMLATKQSADVTLLRGLGLPYTELNPGQITNQIRVKIKNRSDQEALYAVALVDRSPGELVAGENPMRVGAGESRTEPMHIVLPRSAFQGGRHDILLTVSDGRGFQKKLKYRLLGPE
jgi:polyferredoxin